MKRGVVALFAVVVIAVLVHETTVAAPPPPPVVCDPNTLSSCAAPIFFGTTPPSSCCTNLKQQTPCFCQYINDPQFKQFLTSPNALKTARTCGVTIPTTC